MKEAWAKQKKQSKSKLYCANYK